MEPQGSELQLQPSACTATLYWMKEGLNSLHSRPTSPLCPLPSVPSLHCACRRQAASVMSLCSTAPQYSSGPAGACPGSSPSHTSAQLVLWTAQCVRWQRLLQYLTALQREQRMKATS
jgi:hypothetical protein